MIIKLTAKTLFFLILFFLIQSCKENFKEHSMPIIGKTVTVIKENAVAAKCDIPATVARKLSETCFNNLVIPLQEGRVSYSNFFEYEPQYPAYSDGASKRRWIYIPEGTQINTQDPDNWIFPKGTVIFKEFSIDGKKIEVRQMEKISDDQTGNAWRFSNYAWTADLKDAELVTNAFYGQSSIEIVRFNAGSVMNQFKMALPFTCLYCHSGAVDSVNGFNYLQLSSDSIHFNLTQASKAGLLSSPPTTFDSIKGSGLDRKAIGYIQSNCAICHSPEGPGYGNFKHSYSSTALENENVMVEAAQSSLIVKGNPEESYLYQVFSMGQMPKEKPLHIDQEGVSLIYEWIKSLR
jgi:hypothetical protein